MLAMYHPSDRSVSVHPKDVVVHPCRTINVAAKANAASARIAASQANHTNGWRSGFDGALS